ncbi:MAG: hypothetical protein WDN49_18165 [Acetobacteraceae bacterium]
MPAFENGHYLPPGIAETSTLDEGQAQTGPWRPARTAGSSSALEAPTLLCRE